MPNTDGLTIRPLGQLVQALTRYSQNLYQSPKDTIRGVEPDTWYSPLQPVTPMGPPGVEPRAFQYYAGQNLLWTPRADAEMSAADLKQIATYPVARMAIENVKDAMCMANWEIQPKPEPGESRKAATKRGLGDKDLLKLNRFFEMPDREHTWPEWLRPLLEDMLVIDAWTILIRKTFSGEIVEMPVLRGESIVRYIDENGFTPLAPEPAYAQLWWGLPLVNLSTEQLIYKPRNIVPRNTIASQLYGMSPTEQLAPEINIGIQRLAFTLSYYTEGSTPGVVQVVPKGISTEKIAEAMQWMNSELAGNLTKRRQWQLIQGWKDEGKDEQIIFTKEPLLADPFDELHIKKIFYGYGVSPQRVAKQMNRASAQASQEASEVEGLLPFFSSLKSLIDFIIQRRFMLDKYEMVLEPLVEPDQVKQATVLTQYVDKGIMRRNEAREKIGEEPAPEAEANMLTVTTGQGAIPLGASVQAATNPEGGTNGVPGKGKGGEGAADGTGAGAGEGHAGQSGEGDGTVADGRGKPGKSAGSNKPNGGAAAKAQTENRPIGFAAGTLIAEPEPAQHGVITLMEQGTRPLGMSPSQPVAKKVQPQAKPVIHPGRLLPSSLLARNKMERELTPIFKTMRRKVTKAIASQLGLPHAHMEKANAGATLQAALDSLSLEWMKIARLAKQPLTDTAVAGATKGALELNITAEDMLGGINEVAMNWADERAAELVGMKRDADGTLTANPNAKWAITDSTRDKLRVIIRDVLEQEAPRTLRGLENRIEQSGIFSDTRATMIAKTEISRAQTQGNLLSWQESGLVTKLNWILASDHDKDDVCDELAAGSPYPIDEVPELPAHPNCYCALILAEWHEDVE